MWPRALEVWLLLLAVAFANGAFRVAVLIPRLGEYPAHIVSTVSLSVFIVLLARFTVGWMQIDTARSALLVGAAWLACTLAFEFLAGHYVFGSPWAKLLAEYQVQRGRIWVLVLVVTFSAPLWAFSQRPQL
jgi:hypothetical protein